MKTRATIAFLAIAMLTACLAQASSSSPQAALEKDAQDLLSEEIRIETLPQFDTYWVPKLGPEFIGQKATVVFKIDRQGKTKDVHTYGSGFLVNDLTAAMVGAIKTWTFHPARDQYDEPITVKVMLPIKVVDRQKDRKTHIALALGKLKLDR